MKKPKEVKKITRKWMLNFADSIYNPKTKSFLRLCDGYLTNGPDPTNQERKMHCGLGELYYAMTGTHATGLVSMGAVCRLAAEKVNFSTYEMKAEKATIKAIRSLKLDKKIKAQLIIEAPGIDYGADAMRDEFLELLNSIPGENDDGCGHATELNEDEDVFEICTPAMFRDRSKRVAAIFRTAAKLIPE